MLTEPESSKAIQEVAKTTDTLLNIIKDFTKFIGKISGITGDGLEGKIEDNLKFSRWERRARLIERYNKVSFGQTIKILPPKFLIPLIESATLEDEDNLQDLWINLLTSFTIEGYNVEKRSAYIEILKSLTSIDAKILKNIYEYDTEQKKESGALYSISKKKMNYSPEDEISLDNLYRVGCLKNSTTHEGIEGEAFSITFLGISFVEACINIKK